MKVLVYGAGPLGSLFAARLQQGGQEVSILARGQRLSELREHGIVLEDVQTKERSVTRVGVVETLAPDDAYDLVLVVMRKNHALQILSILAANEHTPNVLFLMNNAAGPGEMVEALGKQRVLVGFPGAAGFREGHVVHCMAGTAEKPWPVYFGEVDGRTTARTRSVAQIINAGPGFEAQIRPDMDAWLKYHVALLMPSLAPALYAADLDHRRLARTRDLIVLAIRAIREGFDVLGALGYPVSPPKFRRLRWIPEPIFVLLFRLLLLHRAQDEIVEASMLRHARSARDEITHLANEFQGLIAQTSVPTPAIERLYPYLDPDTPLMPDGRSEIPLHWGGVWIAMVAVLVSIILVRLLCNWQRKVT